MLPLSESEKIPSGTKSLLISGGSTLEGKVPILAHSRSIEELKMKGFRLNFHTGLVDEKEAERIAKMADAISFDFVGDDEVIKKVYNLDATVDDYIRSLENLLKFKKEIYPHITIGLDCGEIGHEYRAIDILSSYTLEKVVFLVFIPTPSTFFENCPPPRIDEIKAIFEYARKHLACELNLGCMYPKGRIRDEIDMAAIEVKFNTITQPSLKIIEYLKMNGYKVSFQDECCIF
jgi:uncharacterized radical SAM superfamily protein